MSRGTTADIDPEMWSITDGKLYLNLNMKVVKEWQEDIAGNIEKANQNWPKVIQP